MFLKFVYLLLEFNTSQCSINTIPGNIFTPTVSLSEVLHDAGANSSFEDDGDDEDDDDILMNEDYKKNWNRQNSPEIVWEGEKNVIQELVKKDETELDGASHKQHTEYAKLEHCPQPDCLLSEKATHVISWLEQDTKSEKIEDNTSREIIAEPTIIDNNGNEAVSSTLMGQNGHAIPIRCSLLMSEDSMEDYIEKQRWVGNNGNTANNTIYVQSVHENGQKLNVSSRMEKLAPPPLVLPSCSGSTENLENAERQRKLSVVTPPVSPVSPRGNQNWGINYSPRSAASSPQEKTNSHWAYNTQSPASSKDTSWNKTYSLHSPISPQDKSRPHWSTQVMGKTSAQISYSIPQHEAIPIMPIPPAETVLVKNNRLTENTNHIGVKGSVLTNGLEGCCGSGPLVDIPAENRITCSVEIHRQKSITSSTTDIHGHTETTL